MNPTSVVRIPSSDSAAIQVPMPYQAIAGNARRNSTIFEPRTPNADRVWIRYGIPYLFPGSPFSENIDDRHEHGQHHHQKGLEQVHAAVRRQEPLPEHEGLDDDQR